MSKQQLDIKDFKVGDTVYIFSPYRKSQTLFAATVSKIGRLYLSVDLGGWEGRYCAEKYHPLALIEKVDAGSPSLLFPSEEAYNNYLEQKSLELWLRKAADVSSFTYSLDQLRKVKSILDRETIAAGAILAPCKVGDPVYYVVFDCVDDKGEEFSCIQHGSVHGVSMDKTGIWVFCRYNSGLSMYHTDDEFGKTVFLSEDEATAALKEGNREKGD